MQATIYLTTLPCARHSVCSDCIKKHLQNDHRCPFCRQPLYEKKEHNIENAQGVALGFEDDDEMVDEEEEEAVILAILNREKDRKDKTAK